MNGIRLTSPTAEYTKEIMEFRQELLDSGNDFAGCGSFY